MNQPTTTNPALYAPTWEGHMRYMRGSLRKIDISNFHLCSTVSGLHCNPSPFPCFEREQIDEKRTVKQWLWHWFVIARHVYRFRHQVNWFKGKPLFEELVDYYPPYKRHPRRFMPLYTNYKGKKFNGNFVKCGELLRNTELTIPKDKWKVVCEIGGGWGPMAEMIIRRHNPDLYVILDLPEMLEISRMYLTWALGDVSKILFLDASRADELRTLVPSIDLFISINCISEIDIGVLRRYFGIIEQYEDVYLSTSNVRRFEGAHLYEGPETYPYGDGWRFLFQEHQKLYFRKNLQVISHLPAKSAVQGRS